MMKRKLYRYKFNSNVSLHDVNESLFIARIATEGLLGHALARLDVSYCLDMDKNSCVVDASTDAGLTIARIFTGFLSYEFGEEAFTVERIGDECPDSPHRKHEAA